MDNQHRKISGDRELSQAEIDLMNEIEAFAPQLEALCNKVKAHVAAQITAANTAQFDSETPEEEAAASAEVGRLALANPQMWADWGKGSFQGALMYLTRAVAQPSFF